MKTICIYDQNGMFQYWWLNFDHATTEDLAETGEDYDTYWNRVLAQHGGRVSTGFLTSPILEEVYLEFDNDADATLFILKWS